MADRYFCETAVDGPGVVLSGSEAHHLARVLRARPGDRVVLFDGSGAEFSAEVAAVLRDAVELVVIARAEINRELPFLLTLAVALPKGDRQRWLVEKAVELGVTRLVPLATSRSIVEASPTGLARLRRAVIEASKQCGRNRLMEVAAPESWTNLTAGAASDSHRWVAHPGGRPARQLLATFAGTTCASAAFLAVGPEGGFTDEEIDQAVAHGWQQVDLGPRILRVETAAAALCALATLAGCEET